MRTLLGPLDSNTRMMRDLFGVHVLVRDGSVRLLGGVDDVAAVKEVLEGCLVALRQDRAVSTAEVARRLRRAAPNGAALDDEADDDAMIARPRLMRGGEVDRSTAGGTGGDKLAANESGPRAALGGPARGRAGGASARPRTAGQKRYAEAIREHDVVLGIGPAGTGKTYLAVAAAVEAVRTGEARRIVLVRPAVEAGEKLGFLPGDLQAKVDPYLRPLYDALHDLLDPATRLRYLDSDLIEVCPLAYMRGRTLTDAFVILDEAQNTTVPQMMMFLTRLGEGSKMVVTGDPSQVDLPGNVRSGLSDAARRLARVRGIAIVQLQAEDVVRHPVVSRIINAYNWRPNSEQTTSEQPEDPVDDGAGD